MTYRDPGTKGLSDFISRYWAKKLSEMEPLPPALREMYARRAEMQGEIIKKTGEVIPKESV